MPAEWRKSTHSEAVECVEVAVGDRVGVRDSKDPAGGQLSVSPRAWSAALRRLR
jgi:hypothetical protein